MALRPRPRAASISSRYGSQALAGGRAPRRWAAARQRAGGARGGSGPRVGGHLTGRFWRRASRRRRGAPHGDPGGLEIGAGRLAPDARRLLRCAAASSPAAPAPGLAVFFSSLKMLAMPAEGPQSPRRVNVLGRRYLTGRFSGVHVWPVLGVHRGKREVLDSQPILIWIT